MGLLLNETFPGIDELIQAEAHLINRDAYYTLPKPILGFDITYKPGYIDASGNHTYTFQDLPVFDWNDHTQPDRFVITPYGLDVTSFDPLLIQNLCQLVVAQDTTLKAGSTWDVVPVVSSEKGEYTFQNFSGVKSQQSYPYIFQANGHKFLVKTTPKYNEGITPLFFEELTRLQQLERELGSELGALGIAFPKIIYATGYMYCREFVEGSNSSDNNLTFSRLLNIENLLLAFIHSHKEEELWKSVGLDLRDFEYNFFKRDGFIIDSTTGLIYIIDPFLRIHR